MSQLKSRVKIAALSIPPAIVIILWGGWAFGLFAAIICIAAQSEFYRLAGIKGLAPTIGAVWGGLLPLIALVSPQYLLEFTSMGILLVILTASAQGLRNIQSRIGVAAVGIIYPSLFLSYLILIRQAEWGGVWEGRLNGTLMIVFILSTIWICDTAAYFGGKIMGRKKLARMVSPNKTWEGFFWGLIGGLVWAALFSMILSGIIGFRECLGAGLIVGTVGQLGDLAESALKRSAGVKDSGNILGPHGGVLDRLDSLIAVAPVFFIYFKLLGVI